MVRRFQMITFEQYKQNPTIENRNKLVEQHGGLVGLCAKRMASQAHYEDLLQVGHFALIKCVMRFDPASGYKFSSYAMPHIRGAMGHYLRDHGNVMRTPRKYADLIKRGEKLRREMDNPTDAKIAEALEISQKEWVEAKAAHRPVRSLDAKLTCDGESTLLDVVVSNNDPYLSIMVDEMLSTLPKNQRSVIEMKFYSEMTQPQMAAILDVSVPTIARHNRRAMERLKKLVA
jgi:RNA polymerase sigma-B factor